jgi:hypothetical protein
MRSLEELPGVWGAECCDSRWWNKGDLIRSKRPTSASTRDISLRWRSSSRMTDEKSEEAVILLMVETTELDRREGPLLQPC